MLCSSLLFSSLQGLWSKVMSMFVYAGMFLVFRIKLLRAPEISEHFSNWSILSKALTTETIRYRNERVNIKSIAHVIARTIVLVLLYRNNAHVLTNQMQEFNHAVVERASLQYYHIRLVKFQTHISCSVRSGWLHVSEYTLRTLGLRWV